MDEEAVGATDNIVTEFATYEDFLDSQITPLDLYYLEVMSMFISRPYWVEFTVFNRELFLSAESKVPSMISKEDRRDLCSQGGLGCKHNLTLNQYYEIGLN